LSVACGQLFVVRCQLVFPTWDLGLGPFICVLCVSPIPALTLSRLEHLRH
jgi:hypothetical protein